MNALVNHLSYDFKTGVRDRSQMMMIYLFPLVVFALMGLLMTSINPDYAKTMIPGLSVFAFMSAAVLSLPGNLVTGRERGIFRSFRINGVKAASAVFIPVVGLTVHLLIVAGIIAAAGGAFFRGSLPAYWARYATATLVAITAHTAAGSLIGAVAGNHRASMLIGQVIFLPSTMLGGIIVPTAMLPSSLAPVSRLLPASHAMRLYVEWAMVPGGPMPWVSLAVLLSGTACMFAAAFLLFEWDSNNPRKRKYLPFAALALLPYILSAAFGG
jgi:ABC-2 type transport system permease protein